MAASLSQKRYGSRANQTSPSRGPTPKVGAHASSYRRAHNAGQYPRPRTTPSIDSNFITRQSARQIIDASYGDYVQGRSAEVYYCNGSNFVPAVVDELRKVDACQNNNDYSDEDRKDIARSSSALAFENRVYLDENLPWDAVRHNFGGDITLGATTIIVHELMHALSNPPQGAPTAWPVLMVEAVTDWLTHKAVTAFTGKPIPPSAGYNTSHVLALESMLGSSAEDMIATAFFTGDDTAIGAAFGQHFRHAVLFGLERDCRTAYTDWLFFVQWERLDYAVAMLENRWTVEEREQRTVELDQSAHDLLGDSSIGQRETFQQSVASNAQCLRNW